MKTIFIFLLFSSISFAEDPRVQALNISLQYKLFELDNRVNDLDSKLSELETRVQDLEKTPATATVTVAKSSSHWSIEGDWNPSRNKVISHLLNSSNHSGKYSLSYLNSLTLEQLKTLHDSDHEKVSSTRTVSTVSTVSTSYCPNGNCPLKTKWRRKWLR